MEERSSSTGTRSEVASERPSYDAFGERVAGILAAAEQAAARIESDAKDRAAEILREAEATAAARREAAASEANSIRGKADEAAAKVVGDAEVHASASREAAEEMARRIAAAARKRQQEINQLSGELQSEMRRMLDGARDVASRLEIALGDRQEDEPEAETLVDALRVERSRRD